MNYRSTGQYGPTAPLTEAWAAPLPIDPALISLPNTSDVDLQDAIGILKATGRKPVTKVAGSRTKEKPYLRKSALSNTVKSLEARPNSNAPDKEDNLQQVRRGRPAGARNFNEEETSQLLQLTRDAAPMGNLTWQQIGDLYNEWAKHNRRPERPAKSLETRFKAVRPFIYLFDMC